MTPQQLKVLAIVVGALLAFWGVMALLPSGTDRPTADFRLPTVVADSVVTITVSGRGDTVTLARGPDSTWTVNGFAAARSSVDEFLGTLRLPVRPELVARSAASFARLGVDSTSGLRLRVAGRHGMLLDVMVSMRGPEGSSDGAFVRLPGDSAVYAWTSRLGQLTRRRVDDWRDRKIATVVPDSVRRIDVARGPRRYTLRHQDQHWLLGTAPADSAAAARLLDAFKTVNADGFPTRAQLDSAFRRQAQRHVALYDAGAAPLLTLDFDSTSNGFWVRRSAGGTIYRLSTWVTDQLTPADSTLRPRKH